MIFTIPGCCSYEFLLFAILVGVFLLWCYSRTDADFTLKLVEYFGKKPNKYFDSKVIWITGSSSGIGEELALRLCKLGVPLKLILSARRVNELERIKLKCLESSWLVTSEDIKIVPLDLMNFDMHKEIIDEVWNSFGKVDVVFHNAGQSQRAIWYDIETTVDYECFRLNALAPTNLTRHLLKYYFENKNDMNIVITSSLAGVLGGTSCASYVAAKHALTGYFRALQTDLADCRNLNVTICCPGLVFSPNNPLNAFTGAVGEFLTRLMRMIAETSLFPDKLHFILFWGYVCLFVNQGVLVTASKERDGSYGYNITTVVLMTECLKFMLAFALFMREETFGKLIVEIRASFKILALYLIPAFLYCLYNNLAFVNLHHYDPTSYFLLLNFRTVLTGVVFTFLFKKQLTKRQWLALIVLTLGCVIKQVRFDSMSKLKIDFDYHLLLMFAQLSCSCFAGVYNEFLLKDTGSTVHIMVQNLYMYVDSIVMNLGFMILSGDISTALTAKAMESVMRPSVLAVVMNNGVAGITTSIFLKKFNSILKTFAGAIELLLTAVVSYILFAVPIDAFMLVSIALVSLAMYLYSSQPVINKPKEQHVENKA